MRKVLFFLLFSAGVLPAHSVQEPARTANADVSGRWVVNTDFYGTTIYFRMELKQEGEKLSGNFDGDKLEGTLKGTSIYFLAKDEQGGTDEKGVTRVLGGNPETGPFYVETAAPGDTLVVHLERVRLNRDWAESDDFIVGRALESDLAVKMKDGGKTVRWHLDAERGVAMPEKPAEHLTRYSVPLRPMLGCVAVAPNVAQAAPGTGDSGHYGGDNGLQQKVGRAGGYLPGEGAGG